MSQPNSNVIRITCPECSHQVSLSTPKPGKYKPTCKKCSVPFVLLIKQDGSFQVGRIRKPTGAKPEEQTRVDPLGGGANSANKPVNRPGRKAGPNDATAIDGSAPDRESPQPKTPGSKKADVTEQQILSKTNHLSKAVTRTTARPNESAQRIGGRLGGYQIIKEIGEGGMGSVYLARQLSLDRTVALKLVQAKWARNPSMTARLTREAYAAAQLNHHNVVQIFDLCSDQDINFFSMEFVDGPSLGELVKKQGRIDPQKAASYILQAARGLQCAHNHGMIHRDVKPANLLLSPEGVVKLADLGLVKIPDLPEIQSEEPIGSLSQSTNITRAGSAVGTASYMAPEQADNASNADHRADIYSLGCTFYVLLTGRPPFKGDSVEEVISKHREAKLVRPDALSEHVPHELADIVARMMAKKPGSRYANIGQLISELESVLGIHSDKGFSPTEKQIEILETNAKHYNKNPLVFVRNWGPLGVGLMFALLAIVFSSVSAISDLRIAFAMGCIAVLAPPLIVCVTGWREGSFLFERIRGMIFGMGFKLWTSFILALLVGGVLAFLTGTIIHVVLAVGLAVGIGFLFDLFVAQQLASQREPSVEHASKLLRQLRVQGVPESDIQSFVANYSGIHWEEFFEQLFGYQAKRELRRQVQRTEMGRRKKKFWAWRDMIADRIATKNKVKNQERLKEHIEQVEEKGLRAEGVGPMEAKLQAQQIAIGLVEQAARAKIEQLEYKLAAVDPAIAAQQKRDRIKAMLLAARQGKIKKPPTFWERYHRPLDMFFGPQIRFILGLILIAVCGYWAFTNGYFSDSAKELGNDLQVSAQNGNSDEAMMLIQAFLVRDTNPLPWPIIGMFINSFSVGMAGLMLVFSVVCNGPKFAIFGYPAALLMILGPPLGVPGIHSIGGPAATCVLIGVFLGLVGAVISFYDET